MDLALRARARRLAIALRVSLRGRPPDTLGVVVANGGMFISDLAFNLRHDLELSGAVTVALATQVVVGALAVMVLTRIGSAGSEARARPVTVLAVFALCGVVRTSVLVAGNPHPSWALWLQQLPPRVCGAMVWFTVSAVLLEWLNRAAGQRMRLETAYRQLLATRAHTAAVLCETDAHLSELVVRTRAAITELGNRLRRGLSPAELDACIDGIGELVDREVRPSSHELALPPSEFRASPVPPLWPSTRVRLTAVIRRWPLARPFQPGVVALLAIPVVLADMLVTPEEQRALVALHSVEGLVIQIGALALAAVWLAPRLPHLRRPVAIAITGLVYLVLFTVGLSTLLQDALAGIDIPLSAHLFPSGYAVIAGGAAAAGAQLRTESAQARRVLNLIGRSLSRTRQQLWARRHRLSLSLHGRVQANLTAASLLLQRAREEYVITGVLDDGLIDQVRDAMHAAWQVDSRSPGSAGDRLARVSGVWAGIMPVDLVVDDASRSRLDADDDSGDASVEVVRELLLNAARHGRATGAVVRIEAADPDLVRITVRETGGRAVLDQRSGTGLGGTMIDSVADRWWVHLDGTDRVTTVLLPTGLSPSAVQRDLAATD